MYPCSPSAPSLLPILPLSFNSCGFLLSSLALLLLLILLLFVSPTLAEESQPSPLVAMLISGVKGTLVKYWILFCCSMFFVISFSGKVDST